MGMNGTSSAHEDTSEYIAWRPPRPEGTPTPSAPTITHPPTSVDLSVYPKGERSFSGISIRAFLLGTVLGISFCVSIYLSVTGNPLWRVPFFLASLCLFHFLEFYITAEYNTREANVSAFLLTSNGWAYNIAHGSALLEALIGHGLFPRSRYFSFIFESVLHYQPEKELHGVKISVVLGLFFVVLGQAVRTLAMAQAGSNFNHTVQAQYKEGHRLVRDGIYAFSRHPSYFGFFWWGLGTQLVLGNAVCFVGYALVLWKFFTRRIFREEKFLIAFFGDDYVDYKKTVWVGIPGIS